MARIVEVEVTVQLGDSHAVVRCGFDLLRPFATADYEAFALEWADADGSSTRGAKVIAACERLFDASCKGVTVDGVLAQTSDLDARIKESVVWELLGKWRARGKAQPDSSSGTGESPTGHVQASPDATAGS